MSAADFLDDFSDLIRLYLARRFEEAIATAHTMQDRHPRRTTDIRHARACLHAVAGQTDQALTVMGAVVDAGSWWSPDRVADPDLDPLRADGRFEPLADEMRTRHDHAVRRAMETDAVVRILPPRSGSAEAAIVALHMYGVTVEETAAKWQPASDRYVIAIPGSPLRNGDGQPCWDEDGVADRAVEQASMQLRDRPADGQLPLVLAGASQGAQHAARIALTGSLDGCVGFLCVVGAPAVEEIADALPAAQGRGMRGALVAGRGDELTLPRQRQLHERLEQAGIPSQLLVIDGMGHTYPDDFSEVIGRAVGFLTGQ